MHEFERRMLPPSGKEGDRGYEYAVALFSKRCQPRNLRLLPPRSCNVRLFPPRSCNVRLFPPGRHMDACSREEAASSLEQRLKPVKRGSSIVPRGRPRAPGRSHPSQLPRVTAAAELSSRSRGRTGGGRDASTWPTDVLLELPVPTVAVRTRIEWCFVQWRRRYYSRWSWW